MKTKKIRYKGVTHGKSTALTNSMKVPEENDSSRDEEIESWEKKEDIRVYPQLCTVFA